MITIILTRAEVERLSLLLQSVPASVDKFKLIADSSNGIGQALHVCYKIENNIDITANLTDYSVW